MVKTDLAFTLSKEREDHTHLDVGLGHSCYSCSLSFFLAGRCFRIFDLVLILFTFCVFLFLSWEDVKYLCVFGYPLRACWLKMTIQLLNV